MSEQTEEKNIFEVMKNIKRMSDCIMAAYGCNEKKLPDELWTEIY